jgi:beta-galactosidase
MKTRKSADPAEMIHLAGNPSWTNPALTELNRLPARASFSRFSGLKSAGSGRDRSRSLLLDGEWDFRYLARPEAVTPGMIASKARRGWNPIPVPSNWTLHGYGIPHYTNQDMPFSHLPPEVPEENPTGIYRRTVRVPANWKSRRVHLEVGGAESVLYVYCNGQAVGMGKDSRLPSEFDLTPYIRFGKDNQIVLVVVKWSDASFVEDQDQWWMGGVFRSVRLWSCPAVHLADAALTPRLDPDHKRGILHGLAAVRSTLPDRGPVKLEARILDPEGREAAPRQVVTMPERKRNLDPHLNEIPFSIEVKNPLLWNAEEPHRYTVLLELRCGREREATAIRTGFREVDVTGGQVRVNGRPIHIHGVNRHEHDPERGKALLPEDMWRDARLMKALNLNAVRTSHYPADPLWYEICDEVGLYVIDEANIECHAFHNTLCKDPRWATAFLERVRRMVIRDRNHPSILFWSLGNESGYGPNHDAAAGWVRQADPSRLLHYEGAISKGQSGRSWHEGHLATDVICPMYSSIEELGEWIRQPDRDGRPVIPCEYSHAMGNSNGSLSDYYALFESHFAEGLQGGFIWEWIDHGLRAFDADGNPFYAYGGDFGDVPNDANFVCDGLVGPDRELHPACHELQYLARPIRIEEVDWSTGRVTFRNGRDFAPAEDLRADWELRREGAVLARGSVPRLTIPAGESADFVLKGLAAALNSDGPETYLDVTYVRRTGSPALPAGHLVACEQVEAPVDPLPPGLPVLSAGEVSGEGVVVEESERTLTLRTAGQEWTWDRSSGLLQGHRWKGKAVIDGPLTPRFWRAAIDNDGLKLWTGQEQKALGRWRRLGLDRVELRLRSFTVTPEDSGLVKVATTLEGSGRGEFTDFRVTLNTRVANSGEWQIHYLVETGPDVSDLPRVGLECPLAAGFDRIAFLGRGPWENYSDRRAAARIDVHRRRLRDSTLPYVMPQEFGHHTGTRWLEIIRGRRRLRVSADRVFEFNYTPYSADELFGALHREDLSAPERPWLVLDLAHRGVGTGSCGPDTLERYRLLSNRFEGRFHFSGTTT